MMRRVTLSLFFLTSTDATSRESSALLSLSDDEENNGLPQDKRASGFEFSREILILRIFGTRNTLCWSLLLPSASTQAACSLTPWLRSGCLGLSSPHGQQEIYADLTAQAVSASEYNLVWDNEYFYKQSCCIIKTPMNLAHICINLSAKSTKQDVLDAAQPVNVCESHHGNDDSESNSTPLLKLVENDDADNHIPFNATYTLTLSYRTWREDILCSSIGYNNQI